MTILIVKGGGYSEQDETALKQETFKRVGNEVDFEMRYVDQLEKTAAGKLRFVVSTLKDGQIE
jgi:phenylacetate-CoA ligase